MGEQEWVNEVILTGPTMVLVVNNLKESIEFYKKLGFKHEAIGGPDVQHDHLTRGKTTFILHPAGRDLYFDAFCYTNPEGLKQLFEEFRAKDVEIVNGPHWSEGWSEMTIRDNNGYRIAFGG